MRFFNRKAHNVFNAIDEVRDALGTQQYIASDEIATVMFLAERLGKPVLAEGPAGVGKTELAKAWAGAAGRELIRLQCYEGLDETKALYEWEYAKQLLYTQLLRDKLSDLLGGTRTLGEAADRLAAEEDVFFSDRFLLPRPLLRAITSDKPVTLLIDEVDRADAEFEAFLLEVLSDFQVSVPELGHEREFNVIAPVGFERVRAVARGLGQNVIIYVDREGYPLSAADLEPLVRRFDEIVAFAELEDFIDAPVKTYSSGMYMRLGFAVAIHVDPDILLVDEVLAVGDEGFTHKCLDKFGEFKRRGKTILLVTHSLQLVERFCDEALWLDSGRIRGVNLQGNEAVRPIFERYLAPFNYLGAKTLTTLNTGGTDHMPFDALSLPGFQFIQDPLAYDSRTHHTNLDVYESVVEEDLQQASVIMASFVYHTAMRDEKLPRKPMAKAPPAAAAPTP